ncbi:MAG: FAD-binding oxidoreductase, partial [Eubacteriales bacterium]
MAKKTDFTPEWYHEQAPAKSYRSILKWGSPTEFKAPNSKLYKLMKETFEMTDEDFKKGKEMGLEAVSFDCPSKLNEEQINSFREILGDENVKTDNYTRLSVAYGKTMLDLMRLRKGVVENLPDVVLYPR